MGKAVEIERSGSVPTAVLGPMIALAVSGIPLACAGLMGVNLTPDQLEDVGASEAGGESDARGDCNCQGEASCETGECTSTNGPDTGPDLTDDGQDAGMEVAEASCRMRLCGTACVDTTADPDHCGSCSQVCSTNEICQASNCVCASGFHLCAQGGCLDNTSVTSCGSSCTPCAIPGAVSVACIDAGCVAKCPLMTTLCNANTSGAACVDTTSDPHNCGACGRECSLTDGSAVCQSGACL